MDKYVTTGTLQLPGATIERSKPSYPPHETLCSSPLDDNPGALSITRNVNVIIELLKQQSILQLQTECFIQQCGHSIPSLINQCIFANAIVCVLAYTAAL